jgi:hypothetical protein
MQHMAQVNQGNKSQALTTCVTPHKWLPPTHIPPTWLLTACTAATSKQQIQVVPGVRVGSILAVWEPGHESHH